jgi:glycosyltransferase involved in cell wall biosynthesis
VTYIKQTLACVIAQEFCDFEVIVIDDGSTDGSADLAAGTGDGRIRVERFANAGVSAARNRGIALARSSLVAFLDADDCWEPGFLGTMLDALAAKPEAVAAFCAIGEGRYGESRMPSGTHSILIDDYPDWFISCDGRGLWSSNTVAKVSSILGAGGFPEGVQNGEDTDTWFRLAFTGPIVYVPKALSKYTSGDGSSLSRSQGAVEPLVISTIKKALASGSIPAFTVRSSLMAVSYFRLAYAIALAQHGMRRRALVQAMMARPQARLIRTYLRLAIALVAGR